MKAKTMLVLHGKQAANEDVRMAVEHWREQGNPLDVRVTWEAGDTERIVHNAIEEGYKTLIAGGGDGTCKEVAEVIAKSGAAVTIALMPLGTANDFCQSAGISLSPSEALSLLKNPAQVVDMGMLDDQYFLNMATGGFGADVTANTPEELKKILGGMAYLLTGLSRFSEVKSSYGHFRGPDFEWEGEFLALGVGNGRQAGGGHALCPNASINDGLLDVAIIPASSDLTGMVSTLINGGFRGIGSVAIKVRVPWIDIETRDQKLNINLDGEPLSLKSCRIAIKSQAIRLHLPIDCPLLAKPN